jgi:hypothetical protein
MILSERYPHVIELVKHYAQQMADETTLSVLINGIRSEQEAKDFSLFIWRMVDRIHLDMESSVEVLGNLDNRSMLRDLSYEMDVFMEGSGYLETWEQVSEDV